MQVPSIFPSYVPSRDMKTPLRDLSWDPWVVQAFAALFAGQLALFSPVVIIKRSTTALVISLDVLNRYTTNIAHVKAKPALGLTLFPSPPESFCLNYLLLIRFSSSVIYLDQQPLCPALCQIVPILLGENIGIYFLDTIPLFYFW